MKRVFSLFLLLFTLMYSFIHSFIYLLLIVSCLIGTWAGSIPGVELHQLMEEARSRKERSDYPEHSFDGRGLGFHLTLSINILIRGKIPWLYLG